MRILEDGDAYIVMMDWAEETVDALGIDGARKLKEMVDANIKDMEKQPASEKQKLELDKLVSVSFCLSRIIQKRKLKIFMAPGLEAIERVKKHNQDQQKRRLKRETWKGLTKAQMEERNQKILEHFKKTKLSPAGFAEKHSTKYGLKPTRVRQILKGA